jgi:hypothetical protein
MNLPKEPTASNPERPQWEPSEETLAVRRLVDVWGRSFALKFFPGIAEHELARCYYGMPIEPAALAGIKKVLKERMTND